MDRKLLISLSQQMGINAEHKMISRANELHRLMQLRLDCSNLAALNLSASCRLVMCLELAATQLALPITRTDAIRVSGMTKRMYVTAVKAVQCMLDMTPSTSVADITVQFGCPQAKSLALRILTRYQQGMHSQENTEFSQVLFNAAAVFVACRKQRTKVDKMKLSDLAGAKKSIFNALIARMEPIADSLLSEMTDEAVQSTSSKWLLDEIETMMGQDIGAEKGATGSVDVSEEMPYKEWKDSILQQAYEALGRTYTAT